MKNKVWKFCENRDLIFKSSYFLGYFENEFLKLDGRNIIIFGSHLKGYAWDGCSPKRVWLDLCFGTPDGATIKQYVEVYEPGTPRGSWPQGDYKPKTYYASLIHDILYQFLKELPISRELADLVFREQMEQVGFLWAKPYWLAVRGVGGLFSKKN